MISKPWGDVSKQTIANCFRHGGLTLQDDTIIQSTIENEDSQQWEYQLPLPESLNFDEYVLIDKELEICSPMTDEEIVQSVQIKRIPTQNQKRTLMKLIQPRSH